MQERVARRITLLEESSTIRMAKLSRELRARGQDIINLSLGEPDFLTPRHICQAAHEAIDDGYTHYPPVAGYADLREAIAQKHLRDNSLEYNSSQIVVSTGAKQSVINVILSLLEAGDEIIIPTPYWVSYPEMVKLSDATTVYVETTVEEQYKMSPEQLEDAITPRTRALLLSSPSNPTGSVYDKAELEGLAEVLRRHPEVVVISDEIYEYINFRGEHFSLAQHDGMLNRTVIVNGASKGFAMTGWRVGWIAGPEWISKACEKLQGQYTSAASSISQRATLKAITSDLGPTREMRDAFRHRRDLVVELMKSWQGVKYNVPEGAFYLFPDVSHYYGRHGIAGGEDFCMYLLREAKVSLVSGDGFGAPQCLRLSYAASEDALREAMSRISTALHKLD